MHSALVVVYIPRPTALHKLSDLHYITLQRYCGDGQDPDQDSNTVKISSRRDSVSRIKRPTTNTELTRGSRRRWWDRRGGGANAVFCRTGWVKI